MTEKERFIGHEEGKDLVLLRIAGGTALVSLMRSPIPGGELQDVCRFAWHWPQACDTVKDHKAHALVVLMGTRLSKAEAALVQTKVVAAVVEDGRGRGLLGYQSQRPKSVSGGESQDRWRPDAHTAVDQFSGKPRCLGPLLALDSRAQGLSPYEIEVKDAGKPFIELYGLVEGMAAYLIAKGPIIRDGETIGHSNEQRIRVRHGASYWRDRMPVYRLEFDR